MEVRKIARVIQFDTQKMKKVNLFETSRMFCDLYCLEPGQRQELHTHEGCDKIYHVLEGRGRITVGGETRKLEAGEITFAPSGEAHGVENDAASRLTCLVFMAPHPNPGKFQ